MRRPDAPVPTEPRATGAASSPETTDQRGTLSHRPHLPRGHSTAPTPFPRSVSGVRDPPSPNIHHPTLPARAEEPTGYTPLHFKLHIQLRSVAKAKWHQTESEKTWADAEQHENVKTPSLDGISRRIQIAQTGSGKGRRQRRTKATNSGPKPKTPHSLRNGTLGSHDHRQAHCKDSKV